MIRKSKQILALLVVSLGLLFVSLPAASVSAAVVDRNAARPCEETGWKHLKVGNQSNANLVDENVCCPPGADGDATECLFAKYVNPVVVVLGALTGIAVVIGIVMGGIQYASSAGDPQRAAKGKGMIVKALVGLVSFMFLYSALQFFSPGGISSNVAPTEPTEIAAQCSREFLGLKPWFAYLPDEAFRQGTCEIENFSLLGNGGTGSHIGYVMLAVADDLIRVAALIAVAFVVVGGIQFVASQGDPEKAKRARQTILNAVIGVIVAVLAAALVSYIGGSLTV